MALHDQPKTYGSVVVAAAFLAGVLVTLGLHELVTRSEQTSHADAAGARQRQHQLRQRWLHWLGGGRLFRAMETEGGSEREGGASAHVQPQRRGCGSWNIGLIPDVGDIRDGIEECIGGTPLVRIRSLSEATGCTILAKAEFLNGAGGSPKDRVALSVIRDAEARGLLVPGRGDTIYEGTVGSTGISLAVLARARGYRAHICMPDDQSLEKSDLLLRLGATVERVPVAPIADPRHFVNLARAKAEEHTAAATPESPSRGFYAGQFDSTANYTAHHRTTGPEILRQAGGAVDAFVAGAGTGGTLSGVAMFLKEEMGLSQVRVVLADPQGSGLFNRVRHGVMYSPSEREGTRRRQQVDSIVEGVGLKWLSANFEAGRELIDDAVRVTDVQACRMARWLVDHDGIFIGSSSAVNCVAAVVAARSLPRGSRIVTVLCDSGSRHLSRFWKEIAAMDHEGEGSSGEGAEKSTEGGEVNTSQHEQGHAPLDLFALLDIPPAPEACPPDSLPVHGGSYSKQ